MAQPFIGPIARPESPNLDIEESENSSEVSSPPSISEQKSIIKNLLNQTPQLNQTWFLICAKWFDQWKALVHFDDPTPNSETETITQDKLP